MRYSQEHREKSRHKVLTAAGRSFRQHGYGGIGIDGVAKEAGLTSGAFYWHFPSKEAAFKEAVEAGMRELRDGIRGLQDALGPDWLVAFVDFYLGTKRTCELADSCALPSLTPDVVRATTDVRLAYEAQLDGVVEAVVRGLAGAAADRRGRALALLSLLSGAVTTARAVVDPALRLGIADAARTAALAIAGPTRAPR